MDSLDRANDQCYSSAALTAAGAETVYDTTVTLSYTVDGVFGTAITAVTDGVTPTTDINTGAAFLPFGPDQASIFVWMTNAGGTVAVAQGDVVDVDGDTDLRLVHPQFPVIPTGYTPFAYHMLQGDGTASAFTFGVSNWNATGITKLIKNIARLPKRPVSAATA